MKSLKAVATVLLFVGEIQAGTSIFSTKRPNIDVAIFW